MNLRKYISIFKIIFYIFLNTFLLQSIKAEIKINNEIPQNNQEEKLKSPNLQEDLYILGSGDSIIFSVIGAGELKTNTKILNDGKAIIPLLGPVKLKGLTISGASQNLETILKKELINPKVELYIIENSLKKNSFVKIEKFIQEILWRIYWRGWLELRPLVYTNFLADFLADFITAS